MGLTFANYVIKPFFIDCPMPESSIRLLAAVAICILTFINCWNVRVTTKVQDVFMVTKVGALLIIVVAGIVTLCKGSIEHMNLPRAIFISLPLVTVIYVLANVAYLAVLTPNEMLASNAIACGNYMLNFQIFFLFMQQTFANKIMGSTASWIMPLLVALSAFGGLSVHIMTSSRLCFVGARQGHFPDFLAMINVRCNTPVPSLIFLGLLSLGYLCTTDIYLLIEYSSFVESMFILISIAGLLYMRIKYPDKERPIKVMLIVFHSY
ncbi:hypothetical protein Avbf_15953 [Armadillidium vulgare]|nr:hypothetical protein Avbf_15953 [Armadillidium vulgare]